MRINGNFVLNSDATGEIQNVYIERLANAPTFNASEKGRIYFNTTTSLFYFNDGAAWSPFATGGNASTIQQNLNNLIASTGAAVTGTGTWNAAAFTGDAILADATSITDALLQLSAATAAAQQAKALEDKQFEREFEEFKRWKDKNKGKR